MIDNTLILALTDIIQLPEAERSQAIWDKFSDISADELLEIIVTLINVSDGYAHACDEAIELHLSIYSDMHPDKLSYNKPSFHGALNGLILSSNASNQDIICDGCAYKKGTLANSSLSTQSDVAYAIGNCAKFYCHKNIENIDCPSEEDRKRMRPCKGWAQHVKNREAI
ncbi:hypothetical protein KTH93_11650 [Acinetobacter bereziniae]|uniref:hypothetical protein n=1 Tax=Acinetobacter bereziniae TaxID=106648 RepID=UPI0021D15C78|nr:hypothetical protein [Acinetobacter bereziniae]MCU4436123.1 hypothetical protein [Acinetobacter bereziniae]